MALTLKAARNRSGAVSTRNSKMPGSSFATSAFACRAGSKLAKVEGSVCHGCYARKLERLYKGCGEAWPRNGDLASDSIARGDFVIDMIYQIEKAAAKTGQPFHRWFDSGDLADLAMLEAIATIASATPKIKHWLPTREGSIVKAFLKRHKSFPANLVVRVSATMIDDKPVKAFPYTSTVHKDAKPIGHACPARSQGNACGDCRACWSRDVPNVSYPKH